MADSRAERLASLHERMASKRATFEGHWREVAERVRPDHRNFRQSRTEGDKRQEKIFDATAPLALSKFAAAVMSFTMPAASRWHRLSCADPALAERREVKAYLDSVCDALFGARYAPQANFQGQVAEAVMDIGAFGAGVLFVEDAPGIGLRYKSLPLAECFVAEDAYGRIDTLHRKFSLTARQAAQKFGADKLPQAVQRALEKEPERGFDFLHCVCPNEELLPRRKDYRGMACASLYIFPEAREIVDEGGFRTFPFAVPRYETAPGEVYGRSPAMAALPAIKTLNEQKKTLLKAGHMATSPPLLLDDDGALAAFQLRPGALNYGWMDSVGNPRAAPLKTDARVDIGVELMNLERETINDAFFVTLFRILIDAPQITATEAMLRAQEKGQLLGPTMGRIQTELCGPLIARELDILAHAHALPPMPDALAEAGGIVGVEYRSPLDQAQKAGVGAGILQTVEAIAPLAQLDPSVMQVFDAVAIARELAEINGVPERLLRSDEALAAMQANQARAAQAQTILQAAPVAASAAKDFAQAQSLAGSSPNLPLPNLFGE